MWQKMICSTSKKSGNVSFSLAAETKKLVDVYAVKCSGAVPGKAGKATALPRFSKIERGGGSGGGAPHWWSYLALARAPRRRHHCTYSPQPKSC